MQYLCLLIFFLTFTLEATAMDVNQLINRIDSRFSKDPNNMIIASINKKNLSPQKTILETKKAIKVFSKPYPFEKQSFTPALATCISRSSRETINPLLENIALRYRVDANLIRALITNESNYEPLTFNLNAIGASALSTLAQLKEQFPELRINTYARWGKQFASLRLTYTEENIDKAKVIFETLRANSINFDSSYMQINSQHYNRLGLSSLNVFDPVYNIEAGTKIYKDCETRYGGDFLKSVECYNKGSFRGQTSYSDKVYKTYQQLTSATINSNNSIPN